MNGCTYEFHHASVSFAHGCNSWNIEVSNMSTICHISTDKFIWPTLGVHLGAVLSVKYDCVLLVHARIYLRIKRQYHDMNISNNLRSDFT